MSYQLDWNGDIVIVRFRSKPDVADIKSMLGDADVQGSGLRLYVFAAGLNVSAGDIKHLASFSAGQKIRAQKLAAVVPDDASYGLSRMFEAYRDDAFTEARAFRSENEALAWLRSASGESASH